MISILSLEPAWEKYLIRPHTWRMRQKKFARPSPTALPLVLNFITESFFPNEAFFE
jgi:hypothetical protein